MSEKPIVRGFLILAIVALVGSLVFLVYNLVSLPAQNQEGSNTLGANANAMRATEVWSGEPDATDFAAAESRARNRAETWQSDAVLVHAEGSWRLDETWREVETPPVTWFFSYYSADAGKIATVGVGSGDLTWTTPKSVEVPPQPIADFPPAQGPDTAWLSFRAYDGERFLSQQDDALIKLRLAQSGEDLIWRVSALKPPHHLNVKVDAETGAQAK
jgi:hypothetical protein